MDIPSIGMDRFAEICERVAAYRSRLRKIALVSAYLASLSDEDLARAVRLFCCAPARKLSVGYAVLRDAYIAATGWDAWVIGRCHQEVGDTGETISLLLHGRTRNEILSLERAEHLYQALGQARRVAEKISIVTDTLTTYRPLALKYFIKIIAGDLRIGLQYKMVEEAVAAATQETLANIRLANNRLGDLAQVALAARHSELHAIEARLFHPIDFMLAKPLDDLADLPDPDRYIVEHKYDGIRAQVHVQNGEAVIYTRGMEEVSHSYPDLMPAVREIAGSAVLDGELLAWKNHCAVPFTLLQQRLARKKITPALLAEVPVAFIAYDILYRNGELLINLPIEQRRAILEETLQGHGEPLLVSPQYDAGSTEDVDCLFVEARSSANEGLVLKRRGSLYEPGRRSGTWYKVKRPYATLDVVITAAEPGHGKRASVLSDYTFAVRAGDHFLNVGKAYSGLTDQEIRELTDFLRGLALERYGRALVVRPEVVLEVAFDAVQKSGRHKSGYALRFPRIVRWRKDKKPEDCDDLERVRELHEASLRVGAVQETRPVS